MCTKCVSGMRSVRYWRQPHPSYHCWSPSIVQHRYSEFRATCIGVLRAIGARHGVIMTMVQIEGLVIALLGWALAIPLSLPMSVALGRAFGRIMLPLAVTWTPDVAGVVQWLAIVVVVSVAACAWPAWRATRITTRAALAYE